MKNLLLLMVTGFMAVSCVSEFIADPVDPRLPDYTEQGTNTAGAYVDGFIWKARRNVNFGLDYATGISGSGDIYVYHSPDSLHGMIAFEYGEMYVDGHIRNVSVGFFFNNVVALTPSEMLRFNGRTIQLDGNENWGQLFLNGRGGIDGTGPGSLNRGIGTLYIRHVDDIAGSDSVIVSGTFGFDVTIANEHHTVHSGRFDYVVGKSEFQMYY